ncbi:MAG: hypothetical protein NWE76_00465 [Candidatus Bathyarchaeota archaeon]|nr:hypothetical protein [Candidatus Bathyarchaeota archaeon]
MSVEKILNCDEERLRIYRLEVLNNVGYILATLVVSHGLFSYDFFQELMGLGRLYGPMALGVVVCLLAYFVVRLLDLTRYPRTFSDFHASKR